VANNKRGCDKVKYKMMVGTLSIMMMLATSPMAQAQAASDTKVTYVTAQVKDRTSQQTMAIAKLRAQAKKRSIESDILQAQAKVLNINTTGLTNDQIRTHLKTVGQARQLATLQVRAKTLELNIAGLTNDQARTKIKAAERANTLTHLMAQAKTLGIGTSPITL